jgi:hypothetical protein
MNATNNKTENDNNYKTKIYGASEDSINPESEETVSYEKLTDEEKKLLDDLSNEMGKTHDKLEEIFDALDEIDHKRSTLNERFVSETNPAEKRKLLTQYGKTMKNRRKQMNKAEKLDRENNVAKSAFLHFFLGLVEENKIIMSDELLKHAEAELYEKEESMLSEM